MYEAFALITDPSNADYPRFEKDVYGMLKSYWQVFRPHDVAECWPPDKIFHTILREFSEFAWHGPVTLANFLNHDQQPLLHPRLSKMKTLKPNKGYPIMAVSKFLHFYNPGLFPIYDDAVIWRLVLEKRFNRDFRRFHAERSLRYETDDTVEWLVNYISFASWMLSSAAHPEFMRVFAEWLSVQPRCQGVGGKLIGTGLYAMAFEYTIIGAAAAEKKAERD